MECVEAALKGSVRKELAVKSSPQAAAGFLDDLWAIQNGTSCDDFSVDELLDFSNEEDLVAAEEEAGIQELPPTASVSPKGEEAEAALHGGDFDPVAAGELAVPADDLASLEWLSHFVEDSNSEYSAPFPAGIVPHKPKTEVNFMVEKPVLAAAGEAEEPCFKSPLPAKARSKRTRTGIRVWSLGSTTVTDSTSSSTSSSSSSSSPSSSGPWVLCTVNTQGGYGVEHNSLVAFEKPPVKRQKKRRPAVDGNNNPLPPRRCSHCGVQKTPQWRSGPLGAKTLCNACGVRFKSGRLLPEYRPACSPTFSSELHSNHHRKVLEMRKKNEGPGQVETGLGPSVVPSF